MPQASGAHILLDDDQFEVYRGEPNHYVHRWYDVDEEENQEIVGAPGKKKFNSGSLLWTYDDWAGGEGNRNYFKEDFDVYRVGHELNPRIRGQLTGRPNRRVATFPTSNVGKRALCAVGDGTVWFASGDRIHYASTLPVNGSTDLTITSRTAANTRANSTIASNYETITAMAGDSKAMYYSMWHDASGSLGRRTILKNTTGTANSTVVAWEDHGTDGAGTDKDLPPSAGLAMLKGNLYEWTGKKLWRFDIASGDLPLTAAEDEITKVYDTGVDFAIAEGLYQGVYWAECQSTENSIVMWLATLGQSMVYEYKKGVGRPIWKPPMGFTIKGSIYQNGVMYFSGHWGGHSSAGGYGAMYALPLDSYRPIQLKFPRKVNGQNIQMQELAASYGYQILALAYAAGQVFVYDAQTDGLTLLDELHRASSTDPDGLTFINAADGAAYHRIGGAVTFGSARYVTVWEPGSGAGSSGNIQVAYYDDDEPDQREVTLNTTAYTGYQGYFESSKWDYDYPMDKKSLVGFHLSFKPLVANQTIDVYYDNDDDGVDGGAVNASGWTLAGTITSATTGATDGRVFLQVSTTSAQKKFIALKFRVKLSSASAVATPILYAITAEAVLTRKREEWEIAIKLQDEPSKNRPSGRQNRGWRLRDWLETTIEQGNVVTFQDGYRYKDQALYTTPYTTHNVIIKTAEDVIVKPGEGYCRVLLRSVDFAD